MYTTTNFPSKKALKDALASGAKLTVFQPNDMFGANTQNGHITLEGPHYPKPHKWYAQATIVNGYITSVK